MIPVSCSDPEKSVGGGVLTTLLLFFFGGGWVCLLFFSSTYFREGRMDLPLEAIGPNGSNCFSRGVHTRNSKENYSHLWGVQLLFYGGGGVHTRISKETYSHLRFSSGSGPPFSHSWSTDVLQKCTTTYQWLVLSLRQPSTHLVYTFCGQSVWSSGHLNHLWIPDSQCRWCKQSSYPEINSLSPICQRYPIILLTTLFLQI